MRKIMNKLKSDIGFTLAETLMTVLILLMVSGVVAGGVPSAVQAYAKAVEAANAHVALSTTVNALRRELSTAWSVTCTEGSNEVRYFNSATGAQTRLYKDGNLIKVQDFLNYSGTETEKNIDHDLVSETAVTKKLEVTYGSVSLKDDDVVHFTGLTVKTKTGTVIETIDDLYIRVLTNHLSIPEV